MTDIRERIKRAAEYYRRGDLAAARREAEDGLGADPDAGLLQFLGHVCCRLGDFESGAKHLHACLERDAGNDGARVDLARALVALGALDEAEALCAASGASAAAGAELARIRGYALQTLGRRDEAAACYEKVVAGQPGDFETWNNLGNLRRETGDPSAAVEALARAAALRPDLAIIHRNLGGALAESGRLEESRAALGRAVRLAPGDTHCLVELSRALVRLGRLDEAMAPLEEAARAAPGDATVQVEIGLVHAGRDALDESEAAYRRAIAAQPNHAPAYAQLALLLDSANRAGEIGALLELADAAGVAAEETNFARALLARREGRLEESLALAIAASCSTEPHRKAQLIGELNDRLGRPGPAFAAFVGMNRLVAALPSNPRAAAQAYRDRLAAQAGIVTTAWHRSWTQFALPDGRPAPAFLVGFPRSGTTLLDTLLMGHPDIKVIEERPLLAPVAARLGSLERLAGLDAGEAAALRALYFEALDQYAEEDPARLVVDKMPLNMTYAPLLHRLFPEARFIFAERHPADVVLSCFMTNFRINPAMANFLDLGDAARLYDLAMSHWEHCRSVLPLKVHNVRYEELVADLAGAVRPLLEFLGLPWDEALLDHRATARGRGYVATASYAQVTEPIYARASGRWRRYQDEMEAVLPLLAPWAEKMGYEM
jgi:tetratricopeptide (TPR) repeat protein